MHGYCYSYDFDCYDRTHFVKNRSGVLLSY